MSSGLKDKKHFLYLVFLMLLFLSPAYSVSFSDNQIKKPVIICLKGTCSAGKSTLVKSITSEFNDIVIVDEDSIVFKRYPEAIAKRFPDQFATICKAIDDHNLYHSLRTEDIYFKNNTTKEERTHALDAVKEIQNELNKPENLAWKKEVSQSITDEVLNLIKLAVQQNEDILLDAWYVNPDHILKLFPESSTIKMLIYCSLPVAYNRLLERNEEARSKGTLSKKRFIGQLLGSFSTLYAISNNPTQAIECMNKSDLVETSKKILTSLPDRKPSGKPIFTFREISQQEFEKTTIPCLVRESSEEHSDCLYVTPKDEYDVIIDNTYSDPSKTLELFKDFFQISK